MKRQSSDKKLLTSDSLFDHSAQVIRLVRLALIGPLVVGFSISRPCDDAVNDGDTSDTSESGTVLLPAVTSGVGSGASQGQARRLHRCGGVKDECGRRNS